MMMSSLQVCPRDVVASDVVAALEMCPPSLSVEDLKNYMSRSAPNAMQRGNET